MDLGLTGKCAVVIGGANGIGWATSCLLAHEGARVSIWDRAAKTQQRAEELTGLTGQPADAREVDIVERSTLDEALGRTLEWQPQVDVVVHAAAIGSGRFGFPYWNLEPEDWPRVLDVNVMGMVNVAHVIGPHLVANAAGSAVFVSSVAGQIGSPTDPPYSASKAANINFAQCMARDLAPHGVRVNTVCPGMVQTDLNRSVWQAWHDQAPESERQTYEEWAGAKVRSVIPLARWQTPDDVANLIVFLSSDRAANITGQTMNVDGGFVMHW